MVGAGDKRGVARAHEEYHVDEFVRLGGAAKRSRHPAHRGSGEDGARRHAKGADVVRPARNRKPLHKVEKPRLGSAVHRTYTVALEASHGTEAADDARFLCHHLRHHGASEVDCAFEIHVKPPVDDFYRLFIERNVRLAAPRFVAAGACDENVAAAERRRDFRRGLGVSELTHIASAGNNAFYALFNLSTSQLFNLLTKRCFVKIAHHDLRAKPRKLLRGHEPHAARRARDNGDLSAKVNFLQRCTSS